MQILAHNDVAADTQQSQVIRLNDRAGFRAAAGDLISFDFDGCNADPDFTEYPDGLTVQGVRFFVSCHADFPTSVLVYTCDPCGQSAANAPVLYAGGAEALHLTLPAGTTAFGADFPTSGLGAAALRISINEDIVRVPTPRVRQGGSVFAGFLSPIPITQISVGGSASGPVLSRVFYGRARSILLR